MQALRDAGQAADMDHQKRSLKSQFKLADKLNAKKVAILGPDELSEGKVKVRNMASHEERLVDLAAVKTILANFSSEGAILTPEQMGEALAEAE